MAVAGRSKSATTNGDTNCVGFGYNLALLAQLHERGFLDSSEAVYAFARSILLN